MIVAQKANLKRPLVKLCFLIFFYCVGVIALCLFTRRIISKTKLLGVEIKNSLVNFICKF